MFMEMSSRMKEIKDTSVNDPTSKIINYMKVESRKLTARDNMFMSSMTNLFSS